MQLAKIRGTRDQLRPLRATVRHLHDSARRIAPGLLEVPALLSDAEIAQLTARGVSVALQGDSRAILSRRLARQRTAQTATASELLSSVGLNDAYMSAAFVTSWSNSLATIFPAICSNIQLPYPTWEGRSVPAVRLRAGGSGPRLVVLFSGGMHAGELGSADICIGFLYNLLNAYVGGSPIVLGNYGLASEHVLDIVEHLEIIVVPCVNPDGRVYVETSQNWWRKNRNPNLGAGAVGVDINRNFDFLWASGIGSSADPAQDTYRGPAPLSEPETRNIQWLLDTTGARIYLDIHGPSQVVVYPWGDATDQSADSTSTFQNPAWDGKRTGPYKEYIDPADRLLLQHLVAAVAGGANAVRGGGYLPGQSFDGLYPTSGTSDDYAYSRHLVDPNRTLTYACTFEYGGGDFCPEYPDMQALAAEVNAGMLALCDALVSTTL